MKLKLNIPLAIISILLFSKANWAQDFQLSQYDANPLYVNPAMTGLRLNEDWDYRLSLNYRDQKGNVGKSNKIVASGFDMPFNNRFSFGEFIINNNSINSSMNAFNFMLSGAYRITHKNDNRYDRHNLSVGLQAGLLQQSYNQNNFTYDSQYSSTSLNGFDASLPNGESFTKTNTFNFDANIGMYYRFVDKHKKYSPFGGFSVYHLTRPNQSYSSAYAGTPIRFSLQGGCLYTINETFSILPQFLYMNQANVQSLNIGMMGYEKIRCTDYQIMLGVAWRNTDAVILQAGLKYKTYNFRVSYDIATNYLKQFGNRGVEVSLVCTFRKKVVSPDLTAVLIISPDTTVRFKTPVKISLPELTDSVKPLIIPTKPIGSDSSVMSIQPKKSLARLNDSVTFIIPAKPIRQDSSAIFNLPTKPLQKAKDSVKSITSVNSISQDSSKIIVESKKNSPILADSLLSNHNKLIFVDSTELFNKLKVKPLKNSTDSVTPAIASNAVISDSLATIKSNKLDDGLHLVNDSVKSSLLLKPVIADSAKVINQPQPHKQVAEILPKFTDSIHSLLSVKHVTVTDTFILAKPKKQLPSNKSIIPENNSSVISETPNNLVKNILPIIKDTSTSVIADSSVAIIKLKTVTSKINKADKPLAVDSSLVLPKQKESLIPASVIQDSSVYFSSPNNLITHDSTIGLKKLLLRYYQFHLRKKGK